MKKIPLTQGKFALVDDEDYEYLNQWKWYAKKRWNSYRAVRTTKVKGVTKSIRMHRVILALKECDVQRVDHRDCNQLNNQKGNLRKCTDSENARNRGPQINNKSGYKGVHWNKLGNKWHAQIQKNRKIINLGVFFCLLKAARAYDKAAIKHFGEFAKLNFP